MVRSPMRMGRMPYGSLNPMIPKPASIATHAYAPSTFLYTSSRLLKISSALTRTFPVFCKEAANTLRSSSESESVLMWRWTSSSRNRFRSGALVRFPFFCQISLLEELYVSKDNSIWRVDVERLCFGICRTSGGRISH
jgi:hypothetical protein